MNPARFTSFVLALSFTMAIWSHAHAAIVDDFTSDTLDPEWVLSETLRQGGATAVITYDTTTNDNTLTWGFTTPNSGAVQTTLMRDDVPLNVGQYAQVIVTLNPSGGVTNAGQLFGGLFIDRVSEVATEPTFAGLAMDLVGGGQVIRQVGPNAVGSTTITDSTNVSLRLTRLTPHALQGSYSLDGVNHTLLGSPITVTDVAAVGVFNGNARSSQAGTVQFDDFEISDAGFSSTPLLNVDFNSSTAHSSGVGPTQGTDSFVGFESSTPVPGLSQTFGGITVTVDSNTGRNRAPAVTPSGPYADLYSDFSLASQLDLSGLAPNSDHLITFYAYDDAVNSNNTTIFTDITAGGLTNGVTNSVSWNGSQNPAASLGWPSAASSLLVRSNGSGILTFSIGGGEPRLNGFQLYQLTPIPEPASLCLFSLGAMFMARLRQKPTRSS